jgi:predicted SAM-dependent methyltransferase
MSEPHHRGQTGKVYVQYGCGLCAPESWTNFDSSPRLRFERLPGVAPLAGLAGRRLFPRNVAFGDIVRGLPVADESVDGVYASHVLEHLGRAEVTQALANTFRMLKPGGVFRMIVPDLEWRAKRYVASVSSGDTEAADAFINACNIGELRRARGPMALLRAAYGNSGHTWMYDNKAMSKLLAEAGFANIRRCDIADSGDPMFAKVEDRGRFYDSGEPELALEGRKP